MKAALRFFTTLFITLVFSSAQAADFSFLGLTATKEGAKQKLVWQVVNEATILRYEVEKFGPSTVEKIGEVAASGTAEYSFFDEQTTEATFYQVRSISTSGQSTTIRVTYDANPNTFTGTGDWYDGSKWSLGKPPREGMVLGYSPKKTIINGNCTLIASGNMDIRDDIEIGPSGSLTIKYTLPVINRFNPLRLGDLIIKGFLKNEMWTSVNGGSDINNPGIRIEAGGTLNNSGYLGGENVTGLIIIGNKGTFINSGTFIGKVYSYPGSNNSNQGSIVGNTTIEGNLSNSGTLAPGNSPGTVTVTGDYTATSAAIHNFEVGGVTVDSYDRLVGGGAVNLNGKLQVTLINGYTPSSTDEITLMTGTISGTFSETIIPSPYTLVYSSSSVKLQGPQVLPVTFVRLSIKAEGSGAQLTWDIKEEHNVATYEVERSTDGRTFSRIGQVVATGQNTYAFTDATPLEKGVYRVKSVDRDGTAKYSTLVRYQKQRAAPRLQALPAVVQHTTLIQHPTASSKATLTLCTLSGQKLRVITLKEGVSQTPLDVRALKAGTYLLQYQDGHGQAETLKIIKS